MTAGFGEPRSPAPTDDERELLLGFIRWQRQQLVATTAGLDEEQVRWTPEGGLLPLIGILEHVRAMEWRWVEGRYGGGAFPPRGAELVPDVPAALAVVVAAYAAQAERTEAIVRSAPSLTAPCLGDEHGRGPAHELLGFDRPVDLRWALLHVLEETAHHCGHADSTRELLDGRLMRP